MDHEKKYYFNSIFNTFSAPAEHDPLAVEFEVAVPQPLMI